MIKEDEPSRKRLFHSTEKSDILLVENLKKSKGVDMDGTDKMSRMRKRDI